jgi:hypothetical protein
VTEGEVKAKQETAWLNEGKARGAETISTLTARRYKDDETPVSNTSFFKLPTAACGGRSLSNALSRERFG